MAAMELNRFRSEKTYEKDDEFFVSKFKTLRYRISDWALRNFAGNINPSTISSLISASFVKDDMAELAINLDLAERFVDDGRFRFLMVESFVWKFIITRVVGYNGYIWAGTLKDPLTSIRKVLDPSKAA